MNPTRLSNHPMSVVHRTVPQMSMANATGMSSRQGELISVQKSPQTYALIIVGISNLVDHGASAP